MVSVAYVISGQSDGARARRLTAAPEAGTSAGREPDGVRAPRGSGAIESGAVAGRERQCTIATRSDTERFPCETRTK